MKLTLHRADQVGGCITEIESDAGTRLIIDLGHNMPKGDTPAPDKYDEPGAIENLVKGAAAVLYTHNHADHIGFFSRVPDDIPQYLGRLATRLMMLRFETLAKYDRFRDTAGESLRKLKQFRHYREGKSFKIGDISVTPFCVNHSATDSYMLLIKCDGKTLLHTGDFREHGYPGCRMRKILDQYGIAGNVDVLITEGTNLGSDPEQIISEPEVSACFEEIFNRRKNVFVLCPAQDADRLQAIYSACYDDGRYKPLVCETLQKESMMAIAKASRGGKLYRFKENRLYDFTRHAPRLIEKMKETGFVMLIRNNSIFTRWIQEVVAFCKKEETTFVYSSFRGYIDPEDECFSQKTWDFIQPLIEHSTPCLDDDSLFDYNHTTGHASTTSLREICELVAPRTAIIPVHRNPESDFRSLGLSGGLDSKIVEGNACLDGIAITFDWPCGKD